MNDQYVIKSLETLCKVEAGQKLSFDCGVFNIVDKPNGIYRWIKGDSKHITVAYITQVVNSAILHNLPFDGDKVLSALENLKITYHSNLKVVTDLTRIQLDVRNELMRR